MTNKKGISVIAEESYQYFMHLVQQQCILNYEHTNVWKNPQCEKYEIFE